MDKFTRIGKGLNRAERRIAERLGKPCGFSHRGKAEETIYVTILDQEQSVDKSIRTRKKETQEITMIVPSQKNDKGEWVIYSTENTEIAPEAKPITMGDRFQWPLNSGRYYFIADAENIKTLHNGFSYVVKAEACRPLTLGQGS